MEQKVALVTGASGYLGSHLCKRLKSLGWFVVGLDIINGRHFFWDRWQQGSLLERNTLDAVFHNYKFDAVFHLAGRIEVGESVKNPTEFWEQNVGSTVRILNAMKRHGSNRLFFPSTAGVYWAGAVDLPEDECTTNNNPYANSKIACENAIEDSGLDYTIFRYFNLAGCHPDGDIGEMHYPETHLIPRILQNLNNFTVNGDDYKTHDGTCVRDYVHVEDVIDAHMEAFDKKVFGTINLGSGVGYSIKEIIQTVEKVTGRKVNYKIAGRREGDPDRLVADITKARKLLNYYPKHDISSIIKSAYEWEKKCGRIR